MKYLFIYLSLVPFTIKAQAPIQNPYLYPAPQPLGLYPQTLQSVTQQFNNLAFGQQGMGTESIYDEENVRRTLARVRARRLQASGSRDSEESDLTQVTRSTVSALPVLYQVGSAPGDRQCSPSVEISTTNNPTDRSDRFPALTSDFNRLGADCTQYIRTDGTYGTLGQAIVTSIRDRGTDSIFYNDRINGQAHACPNWPNLTNAEKEHFWVWTLTSISHAESTCRRGRISARGTNGTAVGPLQMELEASLNRARASREYPHPNCVGPSITRGPQPDLLGSHENNLRCGLDVLEKQLSTRIPLYRTERSRDIYWQKLRRPNGGAIGAMIRANPNCVAQ